MAGEDDGDESPILVAYFELGFKGSADDELPRAEMWSDGVWRVTHGGKAGFDDIADHLNFAFPPSRFSSARWDCVLKAADEAAKEADAELVIGDEYEPEPAETENGIVH